MTKPTKWHVCPAKTAISLGIRLVWSESSLCAQWVAKDPKFLHADSEDSDQTGRMPRLIQVFAGHTLILLVLSCCGSNTSIIINYPPSLFHWWIRIGIHLILVSVPLRYSLKITYAALHSPTNDLPHDKTNKMGCAPSADWASVWSLSSLSAWRKLGSLATHWAYSEDSDQTGQIPRLIWAFAGRTVILLVLSWGGSFH